MATITPLKHLDESLIRNTNALMYTEYPHKRFWSPTFGAGDFKTALKNLLVSEPDAPFLLYVHIPFCEQLCWFCTCHMLITTDYERVRHYLSVLYREIELLKEFFEQQGVTPNIQEIHLGGGSPTFVKEEDFSRLIKKLGLIADVQQLQEFSIEIDPRRVDANRMRYYHRLGINRISFGVQDFDLDVQQAINRVQPAELTENLLTPEIRNLFKNGVNFDIICGLPHQTTKSIRATIKKVVELSPDRICLNYLHYDPTRTKHQTLMTDGKHGRPAELPDLYERKVLFVEALEVLKASGYVRTGYDHFAKPSDSVVQAMEHGEMGWNALGVTPGRYTNVLGIGIYSISTIGRCYAQNFYDVLDWEKTVNRGDLPIYRGHILNRDDIIRRDVIQTLRNYLSVRYKSIEQRHGINFKKYFALELARLDLFVKDDLVELRADAILITESGYQFTNVICHVFDIYSFAGRQTSDPKL